MRLAGTIVHPDLCSYGLTELFIDGFVILSWNLTGNNVYLKIVRFVVKIFLLCSPQENSFLNNKAEFKIILWQFGITKQPD